MDVEKTIEFLLSSGARFDARMQELAARQERLSENQDKLAANLDRTNAVLVQFIEHTDRRIKAVEREASEARKRSEEAGERLGARIDALVGAIGEMVRRNQ